MNGISVVSKHQTMSSREIAALTGKSHFNVLADVRKMLAELEEDELKFQAIYFDSMNREQVEYALTRELTDVLLTGYSAKLRRAVIVRWQELEKTVASSAIAMPDFSNPVLAARAWADQYEARMLSDATKAEIGSRREATAMNTASQAVRKANSLEAQLDRSKQYATVKRMEMLYHGQKFNWRLLKSAASEMNIPAIDVFDANYGTVKAYHADVWREAFAVNLEVIGEAA